MKKVLSILVCLAILLSVSACKPDNIQYPVEITDPDAQAQEKNPSTEKEPSSQKEDPAQNPAEEQEGEETPDQEENSEEQPEKEQDPAQTEENPSKEQPDSEEQKEEEPLPLNPLAAEDFVPSTEMAGTLPQSGIIQQGTSASPLKNRTISIYTADENPVFTYLDKSGKKISEWDWMKSLSGQNGFLLKRQVKNKAISLQAQRIALYAGKKLSLVQISADELGNGMTLAASARDLLDLEKETFGISKTVLGASNYKLFAPVGNVASLWYHPASMPEFADPAALSAENNWTVEQFKTICANSQVSQRLEMADPLPWATLSGRSPLTLLDGKLDSNLNAAVTREVWTAVKEMDLNALQIPRTTESAQAPLFTYTANPAAAEGVALQYVPLPSMTEGTGGTVTFVGTFFALPKYEADAEILRAALTFAELWCNRYTEVRAGELQALGIKGTAYQAYCDMAEKQGVLILDVPEIREAAKTYLAGLTEPSIDMNAAYEEIRDTVNGLIAARNLYY